MWYLIVSIPDLCTLTYFHQLPTTVMPIPQPKVILTIPDNEQQLISLIVGDLCSNTVFPVTSNIRRLRSCSCGITIYCYNQTTNHEEADNILAHQVVVVASEENKGVSVISNDTDVFVLLLHHNVQEKLTGVVILESPVKDSHN